MGVEKGPLDEHLLTIEMYLKENYEDFITHVAAVRWEARPGDLGYEKSRAEAKIWVDELMGRIDV